MRHAIINDQNVSAIKTEITTSYGTDTIVDIYSYICHVASIKISNDGCAMMTYDKADYSRTTKAHIRRTLAECEMIFNLEFRYPKKIESNCWYRLI